MTFPEERKYFNSPSVYRGSTPKGGGSLRNDFLNSPGGVVKKSALCGWNLKSKIIKSKISKLFRAWHTRYPVVGVRDRGDNGSLRSNSGCYLCTC